MDNIVSSDVLGLKSNVNSIFENLLHEARDFSLSDDMVVSAINSASDFFGLPHPAIINTDNTCEMSNDTATYNDDVIGIAHKQMLDMGLNSEDAFSLVMTHECCHRALQSYGNLDPWEHELACDYFAGVRATMQQIDATHFEDALLYLHGGEHHPVGALRVDFVEYGKQMAQELQHEGIQPSFENCLKLFNKHLVDEEQTIQHCHDEVAIPLHHSNINSHSRLSFTAMYSESEISRFRSDVSNLESDLSYKDSEVDHHQRCVSLVDTLEGHKNGNYDYEVNQLNKAISDRNYTASKLNDAKEKLNNAL